MTNVDPDIFIDDRVENEQPEHFKINGYKTADWAIRKLAALRKQAEQVKELHAEEVAALNSWRDTELEKVSQGTNYFESILRNWHEEQLDADPKAKTISLPGGQLKARKVAENIEIADPFVFNEWALANQPSWVKIEHTPVKAEIKKAVTAKDETVFGPDGEVVPGLAPVPAEVRFSAVTA